MQVWRTKVLPFFILFLFFLLDGFIANFFSGILNFNFGHMVPRLTLICFIIFSFHLKGNYLFFLGIVFGFLFDSYFTGILGIYIASFSLITYITNHLKSYFYPGWVSYVFIGSLMLAINELFVFIVYRGIKLTNFTFSQFWGNHIGATFLGNFILLIILIPLLNKLSIYFTNQGAD